MPANLENSAKFQATALEKVSFHSNPKERQSPRMLKLSHNSPSQAWHMNQWTMNFQMFKLDLEKAEPEIKLPTSVGSSKKQKSSRKISTSPLLNTLKPLTVWVSTNWKILQEMGIPDHLTFPLRNLYAGQEAIVRTGHQQQTGSKSGKE